MQRGTTSVFRWVQDAGAVVSFSERVAGRRSARENVGKQGAFHSRKCGAWIYTDSNYEFARLWQHEDDTSVASFRRCSDTIRYEFEGKARSYRPDFVVEYVDGRVVVEEVKPCAMASKGPNPAKFQAAQSFYAALGFAYLVVTEKDIGLSVIDAASDYFVSRMDPEYAEARRHRRLEQRRVAQRQYVARMSPDQKADYLASIARYQREAKRKKRA